MKRALSDWYIPRDWLFHLGYHLALCVALAAAMILPALNASRHGNRALFIVAFVLAIVGVVLLFIARLPLYRERRFFTLGPKALSASHRRLYWTAYAFIGTAVALMVLLLLTAGW